MFLPLIPENGPAKDFFRRAISAGRLSHAYLLIGPDVEASRRFAQELSKVFYCAEGRACGACAACAQIEHSNHSSVNFYGPQEGKAVVDIDCIRALCERTHYRSSGLEVAVLEGAELMTEPAANALLKTLEEPPGSALLLLIAQSTGALLRTIVSRCHRVYLRGREDLGPPIPASAQEALARVLEPGFYAQADVKGWLGHAFPDEEGVRPALRRLLHGVVLEWRGRLAGLEGGAMDDALRRLAAFLEMRSDLDRNVSPDLVLERLFRTLRRGV